MKWYGCAEAAIDYHHNHILHHLHKANYVLFTATFWYEYHNLFTWLNPPEEPPRRKSGIYPLPLSSYTGLVDLSWNDIDVLRRRLMITITTLHTTYTRLIMRYSPRPCGMRTTTFYVAESPRRPSHKEVWNISTTFIQLDRAGGSVSDISVAVSISICVSVSISVPVSILPLLI